MILNGIFHLLLGVFENYGKKIKRSLKAIQIMRYINPSGVFWLILLVFVHLLTNFTLPLLDFWDADSTPVLRIAISILQDR